MLVSLKFRNVFAFEPESDCPVFQALDGHAMYRDYLNNSTYNDYDCPCCC